MPIALTLSGILFAGCSRQKTETPSRPAPTVDSTLAYSIVETVTTFGPRPSGSPGAAKVATFIRTKAEEFGAKSSIDEWSELTPNGNVVFRNVIAEIPGTSQDVVIVGGHYDSKVIESLPDFIGANDGGSSTGLQLAMIRAITSYPEKPPFTLRFLFFDGEECQIQYSDHDGLHGSKRYARHLKENNEIARCRAVVILDMIGDRDLTITLPRDTNATLADRLFQIADQMNVRQHIGWYPHAILDDHVPFQRLGIPAINIIDFRFGPENRYWHTSEDTMDKISEESLRIVGDLTLNLLWNLP
jgi:glutaminyl-peptide cyclotransferase